MKKIVLGLILVGIVAYLVLAADFTPQGEINLRDVYSIKGATNITSLFYCNATDCYALNQLFKGDTNYTFNQSLTDGLYIVKNNESNLNVNSSDYWDDIGSPNSTQMEDSVSELNIKVSWFTTLWNTILGTKDTDDLTEGTTNLYENQSFNETYADTIYWGISLGSYNATYNSRLNSINSSFLLENTTLFNRMNSVNASLLIVNTSAQSINTTENIQNLINTTGIYSTYNLTYNNYAVANFSNRSNYWDELNSQNATQMENEGGILNLITGVGRWLWDEIDVWLATKDTDDLGEGSTNLYENQSINETYLNTLYWGITLGSYNATYAAASGDNVSWNQSGADLLYWGIDLGSANATYDALITENATWNQSGADLLYWDIALGSANTTYSALVTDNASWNQSGADLLYWEIALGSSNTTYDSYSINVSYGDIFINSSGDNMTGNLDMISNNITDIECMFFSSGGSICTG